MSSQELPMRCKVKKQPSVGVMAISRTLGLNVKETSLLFRYCCSKILLLFCCSSTIKDTQLYEHDEGLLCVAEREAAAVGGGGGVAALVGAEAERAWR